MHVKTLLNFVEKHKGFVYERVRLERDPEAPRLLVTIRAAKRSKPCCSVCGARGPTHSHLAPRVWQGVPLWGITVLYLYAMRRVACRTCERVIVEAVPWSRGKHTITTSFALFLARWAKRMSWKQVAHAFGVSWQAVYAGVTMAVEYGLAHRTLDDVEALGVDEVMWRRGTFLTVVYALDEGRRRLLWIGRGRSKEVLRGFFDWFGDHAHTLRFVATDMWQAYMAVIKERAPQALNVLDRFHISANLNKAVDAVRSQEARALAKQGKDVLKHKRWLLLKAPENLSEEQAATLAELVKINLKTFRAYLLKGSGSSGATPRSPSPPPSSTPGAAELSPPGSHPSLASPRPSRSTQTSSSTGFAPPAPSTPAPSRASTTSSRSPSVAPTASEATRSPVSPSTMPWATSLSLRSLGASARWFD